MHINMAKKFDLRVLFDRLSQVSLDFATLQKYMWVLHLFIIFLFAKSASNLFVSYIDHKIQAPMEAAAKTEKKTVQAPVTQYPPSEEFKVIPKRNIFNPFAKEEEIAPTATDKPKGFGLDEAGAVASSLPFELVGTIILSNPAKSIAAILDKGQRQTESFQVGEVMGGKAKIYKIEAVRVYFENTDSSQLEFIEMKEDKTAAISTFAPSAPDRGETGVRQAGENKFIIDRNAMETALSNPNEILTQARAVPNIVGGKIKGFRIFAIKPGSIYEKLGIKNGDIIERVNGVDMDSPAKALEFYGALTQASDITLDVVTNGQKQTYTYQIK